MHLLDRRELFEVASRETSFINAEGHKEDNFGSENKNKRGEVRIQACASCQRRLLFCSGASYEPCIRRWYPAESPEEIFPSADPMEVRSTLRMEDVHPRGSETATTI